MDQDLNVKFVRASAGRAPALVLRLEKDWTALNERKDSDHEVVLLVACSFGIRQVLKICEYGIDTLMLLVRAQSENSVSDSEILYVGIEHCSFLFQCLQHTVGKERVIVGFGQSPVAE